MNSNLQVFKKNDFEIRTIEDDGEIYFVAKDVAQALGYSTDGGMNRIFGHVPNLWKGGKRIATLGGEQEMLCLTEQGLYFFLGRSDKPKALPYQMWIAGEVVPSIRKHGAYMTEKTLEKALTSPDFLIQLARQLKSEQEKNKALSEKIEENKPKVLFADAVDTSKQSILIGDLAKLIKQNGVESMGQNRLFAILREDGFLIKQKSTSYNMPTQKSMELGLFEIKERVINNPDGSVRLTRTPKVTGKGQIYFINYFLNKEQL